MSTTAPPPPPSPSSTSPPRPFLPYTSTNPTLSTLSNFNPKLISQQSQAPSAPKAAPQTPYVRLTRGATVKRLQRAFSATGGVSRRSLLIARAVAVAVRVLQVFAAMGLLVGFLFLRGMEEVTGWICRVPPAVAIFHTVYYTYHVSGSDRVRTPRSSVSYLLFASTVDIAIICFYAFSCVLTWGQWQVSMTWDNIFRNADTGRTLVMTLFILACSAGGLTLLSLLTTLYLIRVFRRLSSLPPDSNPFLDPVPSKRWSSGSGSSTSAPSLPASSKAAPFLRADTQDSETGDDKVLYHNIPAPPAHTSRMSQLYPATGHLYPASGPVAWQQQQQQPEAREAEAEIRREILKEEEREKARGKAVKTKRVKKSWGNLRAPTTSKRMASAEESKAEMRATSTNLEAGDEREWSFSFRKRSGAGALV